MGRAGAIWVLAERSKPRYVFARVSAFMGEARTGWEVASLKRSIRAALSCAFWDGGSAPDRASRAAGSNPVGPPRGNPMTSVGAGFLDAAAGSAALTVSLVIEAPRSWSRTVRRRSCARFRVPVARLTGRSSDRSSECCTIRSIVSALVSAALKGTA